MNALRKEADSVHQEVIQRVKDWNSGRDTEILPTTVTYQRKMKVLKPVLGCLPLAIWLGYMVSELCSIHFTTSQSVANGVLAFIVVAYIGWVMNARDRGVL